VALACAFSPRLLFFCFISEGWFINIIHHHFITLSQGTTCAATWRFAAPSPTRTSGWKCFARPKQRGSLSQTPPFQQTNGRCFGTLQKGTPCRCCLVLVSL
jgi:hypothetical protein